MGWLTTGLGIVTIILAALIIGLLLLFGSVVIAIMKWAMSGLGGNTGDGD